MKSATIWLARNGARALTGAGNYIISIGYEPEPFAEGQSWSPTDLDICPYDFQRGTQEEIHLELGGGPIKIEIRRVK